MQGISATASRRFLPLVLKGMPFAFLALFFFYPLAVILTRSLGQEGGPLLAPFGELLGDSYYLGRVWFTFWQAGLSTLLTLLVGVPSAYVFARYDFPGKSLLRSLTTIPFVMPPIVMALGFIALLGPQGLVNDALMGILHLEEPPVRLMNTLAIILIAHAIYEYTIVVRIVSTLWANLDPRLEASARVLGAGPWTAFRRVTLPLLLPAIAAAGTLVFLFTFTSFGVVLILGGSQFATMEVTVYTLAAKLFRLPLAAALALLQVAMTFVIMGVYARLQEATAARLELAPAAAMPSPGRSWGERLLVLGNALVILLVLSPLLALALRASTSGGFLSLANFAAIFSNERNSYFFISPLMAMRNSLVFATVTVLVSVPLGLAAAYLLGRGRAWWKSPVDALLMLPLGVSAVTLGFGFLMAFNRPPLDLRATWMIIVVAHILVAYPFVLRSILPVLRSLDPSLGEAARMLGASPARVFRHVELPILARGLLVGATFAFAVSVGEFGATLLLNRPEFTTMPVAIFRYLGQPGGRNLGEALAMSGVLMAVCGMGFLLIERFRYRDVGVF